MYYSNKGAIVIMYTESRIYIKKFISALYLNDIREIPFAGDDFEKGIETMREYLEKKLDENIFMAIEELFDKSPVQEHFDYLRDMVMSLNGETVKFAKVSNPYWKIVSIDFSSRKEAEKILNDVSILDIDGEIVRNASKLFCEKSGVNNGL